MASSRNERNMLKTVFLAELAVQEQHAWSGHMGGKWPGMQFLRNRVKIVGGHVVFIEFRMGAVVLMACLSFY